MQRRGFITGLAAGAVGWVAGGRTAVTTSASQAYANPVPFIASAEAATPGNLFAVDAAATAANARATFPQSVAAGDPNPHGAVIWTRVAPSAITGGNTVAWQVADAPDFGDGSILLAGTATASSDTDYTIKLPLYNGVLRPFTAYYYRFIVGGVSSRTGRFKTLPLPGDTVSQVKIGYVVCQDYSNGFYNAYKYLALEDVCAFRWIVNTDSV